MLAYKALYKKMMDDLKDAGMWIDWAEQLEESHPKVAKFLMESAKERLEDMAEGIRQVVSLEDPVGEVLSMKQRPNGLLYFCIYNTY